MQALVVPLEALDHGSLAVAGGKAANLGELLHAGFRVPGGYCVSTNAYRQFVAASGLSPRIATLLEGLDVADAQGLATAGAAIRDLFVAATVPDAITASVRQAHAPFDAGPVAVRSSATAEDLPEASFAGQQDTYLNVVGTEATLDAVRRCWASLWTDRAIAYRQRNHIAHDSVALAVVVQQMIPAEVAGVLFTANPVNGKRTEAVIDASLGLGEAVVSGAVSPDNFVVVKRSLEIVARRLGAKQVQVVPRDGGGTERVPVDSVASARPALSDEQIRDLARTGTAIEAHFGWPQDVEWAFAGGDLYILQSRPITSLYPLPEMLPTDGRLHTYISLNSAQGMLEPFTPMGVSLFAEMSRQVFANGDPRRAFIHDAGNRLYADVTPIVYGPLADAFPRLVLPEIEPVIGRILKQLVAEGRFGRTGTLQRSGVMRFIWRFRRRFRAILPLVARNFLFPERARHRMRHELIPWIDRAVAVTRQPLRLGEQPDVLVGLFDGILRTQLFHRLIALVIPGVASYKRAEALVKEWGLDEQALFRVRQGLRHNVTTTMDLDLWALSRQVEADREAAAIVRAAAPTDLAAAYHSGTLPATVQTGMRAFLRRYGHRAIREIDLGMPRWEEDPTYLFGVLRNYTALDDPELAADVHFTRQEAQAEQAIADLLAQAERLPDGRRKATMLGFFLHRYRELGGLREAPKFYVMWIFRALRRMMLRAGAELVANGRLDKAEDIFFIRLADLREAGRHSKPLQALVTENRRIYARELARQRVPRVFTSEGEVFYGEALSPGEGALAGTGASPGIARGRARVVRDPTGAHLDPGDVLVAPSTDPAWTPLFLTAGALVMEAGGMMSHGSIVAREYGIPAVVGVAEAIIRIPDGATVEVDGFQGIVRVVGET